MVELGYFGPVFDRPMGQPNLWFEEGLEDNVDLFVRADESRDDIVANYRKACETSNATIEALELDAAGSVPWWGDQPVNLHHVLVHVIAETFRHAGHSDLARIVDSSMRPTPPTTAMSPSMTASGGVSTTTGLSVKPVKLKLTHPTYVAPAEEVTSAF